MYRRDTKFRINAYILLKYLYKTKNVFAEKNYCLGFQAKTLSSNPNQVPSGETFTYFKTWHIKKKKVSFSEEYIGVEDIFVEIYYF